MISMSMCLTPPPIKLWPVQTSTIWASDPVELFSFVNTTGATADFNIMIVNFAGSNPGLMKYILFNFNGTVQEFATNSGTVFGHANAVGAEAVGAARYTNSGLWCFSAGLETPFFVRGDTYSI